MVIVVVRARRREMGVVEVVWWVDVIFEFIVVVE